MQHTQQQRLAPEVPDESALYGPILITATVQRPTAAANAVVVIGIHESVAGADALTVRTPVTTVSELDAVDIETNAEIHRPPGMKSLTTRHV